MLKKDFLIFLHDDWKRNLERLNDDLQSAAGSRTAKLEHIRTADKWLAYYADQLRTLYGVEA